MSRDLAARALLLRGVQGSTSDLVKAALRHDPRLAQTTVHGTPVLFMDPYRADIVKLLLDAGADVRATDADHTTVLHTAYAEAVVRLLIASKADVNAQTLDGTTPLHTDKPLGSIRALLEAKANVNAHTLDGVTPLHRHILNPALVKLLLDAGADPTLSDQDGLTPLHETHSADVARLLLAKGADPNARDRIAGRTPLYMSSTDVASVLLHHGATPNARDDRDDTPLHHAPSPAMAQLLITAGADVNARNHLDTTPLMRAAHWGIPEFVRVFVDAGADVTAQDHLGHTALWYVEHSTAEVSTAVGRRATIDVLRAAGATTPATSWQAAPSYEYQPPLATRSAVMYAKSAAVPSGSRPVTRSHFTNAAWGLRSNKLTDTASSHTGVYVAGQPGTFTLSSLKRVHGRHPLTRAEFGHTDVRRRTSKK